MGPGQELSLAGNLVYCVVYGECLNHDKAIFTATVASRISCHIPDTGLLLLVVLLCRIYVYVCVNVEAK